MKRRLGVVVLPCVLAALFALPAAPAGAQTLGTCTALKGVTISPGITAKLSSGTFKSTAGGTFICAGTVHRKPVAGAGSVSFAGTYGHPIGDNCLQGKGGGSIIGTVPVVRGGSVTISGSFVFVRVGAAVTAVGVLSGPIVFVA